MTDVVAQNLWIDEKVAKAPNLAIAHRLLPPMPSEGDLAIYNGDVFRTIGGWDVGTALPPGASASSGCASNAAGSILVSTFLFIFTLTEEIWDSGFAGPPQTDDYNSNIQGITVADDGSIWAVVRERHRLGQSFGERGAVWAYENGAWGRQFQLVWNSFRWAGIGLDSAGGVLIVSTVTPPRVYRRFGGALDTGTALPTGVTSPRGFSVGANDEWFMVDRATLRVYTRPAGGAWDAGIAMPVGVTLPEGMGVLPNGALVVVDQLTDKVYVNTLNDALLPAARGLVRWNGSQWQNL